MEWTWGIAASKVSTTFVNAIRGLPILGRTGARMSTRNLLMAAMLLVSTTAAAYESDQVVPREHPPEDATVVANLRATELLAEAAARTNARTGCALGVDRAREELAREVHRVMGARAYVPARGELPPMGFGTYAAWLETGPVDRALPELREDLYGEVRFFDNVILSVAGPSSTISLAGVLVGTDKVDHFWVQGFDYWRHSRLGAAPEKAVDWGTATERGFWGLATSGVFSYADLAANYEGMRFYSTLLEPGSNLQLDGDGCVALARPFDWADWFDWRMDEVSNPSVFLAKLADPIREGLALRAPGFCASDELRGPIEDAPWVGRRPARDERTVDLEELCGGEVVGRQPGGQVLRRGNLSLGRSRDKDEGRVVDRGLRSRRQG